MKKTCIFFKNALFYCIIVYVVIKMTEIKLRGEYITLGQLLKVIGLVNTGGETKFFLEENKNNIFVNNELENRRGKKLYIDDVIRVFDKEYKIV